MERPAGLSPKRVWLQEEDCERLNRGEFEAMRCLLGAVSYTAHAKDDLQKRLACIPDGKARMAMVLGGLKAIADDLVGTMPHAAMEKCQGCVEDEVSCRDCGLYRVLESFLPLDSYENGMLCPYSTSEWKD